MCDNVFKQNEVAEKRETEKVGGSDLAQCQVEVLRRSVAEFEFHVPQEAGAGYRAG